MKNICLHFVKDLRNKRKSCVMDQQLMANKSKRKLNLPSRKLLFCPIKKNCRKYSQEKYFLSQKVQRNWLKTHGKQNRLKFTDLQLKVMKNYFTTLKQMKQTQQQFLTTDQLVLPLISLGVAKTKKEVQQLVNSISPNKCGKLDFQQFLLLLQDVPNEKRMNHLLQFFKGLLKGQVNKKKINKNIPFNLLISTFRRRKFMQAVTPKGSQSNNLSIQIMNACKSQLKQFKRFKRLSTQQKM